MNVFSKPKKDALSTKNQQNRPKTFHFGKTSILRAVWFFIGLLALLILGLSFLAPIVKDAGKVDYFDYVSELRSNVLTAEAKNYALRVYALEKETPYAADGVRREMTRRAEVYFIAPSGDKTATVSFSVDSNDYGGEMSYDNVKEEYFFSVSADVSALRSLDVRIRYGNEEISLTARTIKTETTLSPREILEKLKENEPTVFETLTNENGFVGEINLRLISDDSPYYYVGLIEKSGKTRAYLLTSDTGRVLAKRES